MAPVLQVNGEFVENVTPERADALLDRLERGEGVGDLGSRWRLTERGRLYDGRLDGRARVAATASLRKRIPDL